MSIKELNSTEKVIAGGHGLHATKKSTETLISVIPKVKTWVKTL